MGNIDEKEMKRLFKEAVKEWLDDMYASFGKISLTAIGGMVLAVMAYAALVMAGWVKK